MSTELDIILIVEDDPNDALLLKRALRKAHCANPIHVVGDGEKAVEYLRGDGAYTDRERYPLPVLMLLDLKLPRMSGHEVLEWLRQQPLLKRLPVVVLTGSDRQADIDRVYDLGANSYLVKPVGFDALLDIVKTLDLYWTILNERPRTR